MNALLILTLGLFAFWSMPPWWLTQVSNISTTEKPADDHVVFLQPVVETPAPRASVRTSPDQESAKPERPRFQGERHTTATSDAAISAKELEMPAQRGRQPIDENDLETTESDYRDGPLESQSARTLPTEPPAQAAKTETENAEEPIAAAPLEKLLDGPNPVESPIAKDAEKGKAQKSLPPKPVTQSKPQANDPAFSGYQRKAAIVGSISRTGRSALDVEDTPLGRYQALISRAVEQEWQRNCVRHRKYITPGFLTVRFFVETSGRVRSVRFVGEMDTGEVQKGFTLNSIRSAEIPPMPKSMRKEYDDEPLELIFNFYF